MPSSTHPLTSKWGPGLALAATLCAPQLARADFQITYVFTDENGQAQRNDPLTSIEMAGYINQATCACGERLGALVFLNNSIGTSYPANAQVQVFVGLDCDRGQDGLGQYQPCVRVHQGQANDYDDGGVLIDFEQVWLSSRVQSIQNQDVSVAEPIQPCSAVQSGNAGIWVCVDSDDQPGCQDSEFVVSGDSSTNGGNTPATPTMGDDGMGGSSSGKVGYDYMPPLDSVVGFRASPGDGGVDISWDRGEIADINGFRILCADMEGNPVRSVVSGIPTGQARTDGSLYYTVENVCDAPVYEIDPVAGPDPVPSDTGGLETGGRDTEGDVTTGLVPTTTTDTDASSGGDTGAAQTDDAGTSTTDSDDAGEGGGEGSAGSVLTSLDWRYVCTDGLSNTATSERVGGLENGKEYQFLVVAYDSFGNPKVVSEVLTETPVETTDFWEQCEQQGDICGNGGFCQCRHDAPTGAGWLGTSLLLLGLGVARRRGGHRR